MMLELMLLNICSKIAEKNYILHLIVLYYILHLITWPETTVGYLFTLKIIEQAFSTKVIEIYSSCLLHISVNQEKSVG